MVLGKRSDYGDSKYAGLDIGFSPDIEQAVQATLLGGFDFVVTPLVRPDHRPPSPQLSADGALPPPFERDDVLYLGSSQWVRQVVGSVSHWIDPDSSDTQISRESCDAVRAQLAWAAHLGLQAVVLPPPSQPNACARYAQLINQVLEDITGMALWMTIPLITEHTPAPTPPGIDTVMDDSPAETLTSSGGGDRAVGSVPGDGWELWNTVRTLCSYDQLLGCVLKLDKQLPSPELLARWTAEPVKALLVPTHCFILNKRGFPVLPKAHQEFVAHMLTLNAQVILTGECLHPAPAAAPMPTDPTPAEAAAAAAAGQFVAVDPTTGNSFTVTNPGESHPMRPYWEYLAYLFRKLPAVPEDMAAENEYRDYLQAPLQPLQDNLESQTYEVFEKDTTKYVQYEEAVYRALVDRANTHRQASTSDTSSSSPVVLMVVGAGRGPLVAASMRASRRANTPLRVYAVEKNPNAVIHIQQLLRREGWTDSVRIVSADMRQWQAPEPADILVSELLGSFGDNELSPECLDGAQRFLAPGGISIPAAYTSFLAPVTTHKLWTDVRNYKDREHFETPYVVKFHRHHLLAPTQPVFTFVHPNTDQPIDNTRYKRMSFTRDKSQGSGLLHGFAGYFECELYKDVTLSTHPPTHTPNMSSWFPIYFPLTTPVYVPAGATIEAQMWRCAGKHKVWYEWSISAPVPCAIHNVTGRSYYVGL